MVYVGHSRQSDSATAGRECAASACGAMAAGETAAWALAFCGGRHHPEGVLGGLRAVLGGIPVVGGAAIGTITDQDIGYTGFECAVAVFPDSLPAPAVFAEAGLDAGERALGARLGARFRGAVGEDSVVFLFYDSVASSPPPILHPASPLLDGLYEGLGDVPVHLVGAGTVGDFKIDAGYVFDGTGVGRHACVAVVLPPAYRAVTSVLHGCVPVSSFLEITRIEGATVYELDGRPALETLVDKFGMSARPDRVPELSLRATLGRKHGDPFAPYDEAAYVNRLILTVDPEVGSITLFEPDFAVGTKVQVMSRDNDLMLESASRGAVAMVEAVAGRDALLALYIDCAGRAGAFSGAPFEEAAAITDALGGNVPVLGFYSGVEIAPLMGRSRPLDWTGVLTVLCRSGGA